MKCIKSTDGTIVRIKDKLAHEKVTKDGYVYVSKSEWKNKIR